MLALLLVPCGDGGGGIVEIANHFFEIEHEHLSDHEQHSNSCGDDSCSPFCVCSCCSISVNSPINADLNIKFIPLLVFKKIFISDDKIVSSFNPLIWHPPTFS